MSAQPATPSIPAVWVLAADRSHARLFQALPGGKTLFEVEAFEHPEGRLRNHDLVTDAPGRSVGSGYSQGAPTEKSEPTDHETQRFAQTLARHLTGLRTQNRIAKLYLVAEAGFLGVLRAELDGPTHRLVAGEVHRRLVLDTTEALLAALPSPLV